MSKNAGKSDKQGRQKKSGQNLRYINERRHEKSHIRRITKHLKRFVNDLKAKETLKYYKGRLGMSA